LTVTHQLKMAKKESKPEKVETVKNPLDPGNFTDQEELKEAAKAKK